MLYPFANTEKKHQLKTSTSIDSLNGVKRLKLSVGGDIVLVKDLSEPRKRRTNDQVLEASIKGKAKKYYLKYRNLSLPERKKRECFLADEVLAACIDKSMINPNISINMREDESLMVDLCTIIDMIKLRLQRYLKKSFKSVDEITAPPDEPSSIQKFAKAYLPTASRESYNRMRVQYTSSQNIPLKKNFHRITA